MQVMVPKTKFIIAGMRRYAKRRERKCNEVFEDFND